MEIMSQSSKNRPVDTSCTSQKVELSIRQRRQVDDYCETGSKLLKKGKKLQALEYYQAALEIDMECVEAWSGLAAVYTELGKVAKAEEAHRHAVALLLNSMDPKKVRRQADRLLAKYRRQARRGVTKKGADALGVGVYGFSDDAKAKLAEIEDDIKALNAYFTQGAINRQMLADLRKQCIDDRVKRSKNRTLRKLKNAYRWLILNNAVKIGSGIYKVSSRATEREKGLRGKIETLNPKKGHTWCDKTTKRLLKFRTILPKVLKIFGIVAGVAVGLVVIYFIFRFIVYIIIGIIAIKFLFNLFFGD